MARKERGEMEIDFCDPMEEVERDKAPPAVFRVP